MPELPDQSKLNASRAQSPGTGCEVKLAFTLAGRSYLPGCVLFLSPGPHSVGGAQSCLASKASRAPRLLWHVSTFYFLRFTRPFLSTLLTLALGLPVAFLFARYDFRGKAFLRTLTAIPFMLPTVVVAAGFTALLGPRGWVNIALMRLFRLETPPMIFAGTLGAILVAHIFYNTTIVIRIVGNALSHLDPRLEQAARTLGANPRRVFLAHHARTAASIHPGGGIAGLYFRFHQFWRYPAVGRAALLHAGSGDL